MTFLSESIEIIANTRAISGIGKAAIAISSVMGVVPRVGLGRAITLAFQSLVNHVPTKSIRKIEISSLSTSVSALRRGQYILVTGGKGVGKSCLIQTALQQHLGVVNISVESGEGNVDIVRRAQVHLTNLNFSQWELSGSTSRVVFFYKLLIGKTPIVVISVPERSLSSTYADETGATRELSEVYGLRVVIDVSQNSIEPNLKTTHRQVIMNVDAMSRAMIESIREFVDLVAFLRTHRLYNGVWSVFGGSPASYELLQGVIDSRGSSSAEIIVTAIKQFTMNHLSDTLIGDIRRCSTNTNTVLERFRRCNLTKFPIADMETILEVPNKVFRESRLEDDRVYVVPATPAVEFLIVNKVTNDNQVNEILFPI